MPRQGKVDLRLVVKTKVRGRADLAGWTQHHNHGRLTRNQDDSVAVLALLVMAVWHQPMGVLAASHYDSLG